MKHYKDEKLLNRFGQRLKSFRQAADLSLQQIHIATGISKSQILGTEEGSINTGLSYIGLYSSLYGIEPHEILNFSLTTPDEAHLRMAVKKFVKSRGIDPATFFTRNEGLTKSLDNLLKTSFLNSPRLAKDVADYCKEKYKVNFTTTRISKVLDNLNKQGVIEKRKSDKKSKFLYLKK